VSLAWKAGILTRALKTSNKGPKEVKGQGLSRLNNWSSLAYMTKEKSIISTKNLIIFECKVKRSKIKIKNG